MKQFNILTLILTALFALSSAACRQKVECDGSTSPTYANDIAPLMEAHCTSCHSSSLAAADRKGAPLGTDYDTYDATVAGAAAAKERILDGSMPIAYSLEDADACLVADWVDGGTAP